MRLIVLAVLGVATAAALTVVATAAGPNDYVRAVEVVHATGGGKGVLRSAVATCPTGKTPIGGGGEVRRSVLGAYGIVLSRPTATGWRVEALGPLLGGWSVEAWAVCANVAGEAPSTTGQSSGSSGQSSSGSSGESSSGASGNTSGSSGSSGQSSGSSGQSSSGSSGESSSGASGNTSGG
jgi:hypothetical protein